MRSTRDLIHEKTENKQDNKKDPTRRLIATDRNDYKFAVVPERKTREVCLTLPPPLDG